MGDAQISIVMIAAVAQNGVIGVNGDMPWRIPSDFVHFKAMTMGTMSMGKPMIMGRKQFETLGKPLPGRVNIVVTRQVGYQPDGVIVINDFEAAIRQAKTIAQGNGVDEIMIIGGGEIYQLGMEIADRLIISHVNADIGDATKDELVHFPSIEPDQWEIVQNLPVNPSDRDQFTYSIIIYDRKKASSALIGGR